MHTYRPKISLLLGGLFITFMFLGGTAFIAVAAWKHPFQGNPWVVCLPLVLFALLCLAFGLILAYATLLCSVSIDTDANGITSRAFWGASRLEWGEIVRFEVTGANADDFELFDRNGRRINVNPSNVADGEELMSELQERIAPVREAMLRDLRTNGATLRSANPLGPAWLPCLAIFDALCFSGAYSATFIPVSSPGDQAARIFCVGFCILIGLLLLWALVHAATRVLRLTSYSIEIRSVTFHREIPYSEIQSVSTRLVQTKDTSQTLVTIRGAGKKKLQLTSMTPNLPLLVAFLQERAGSTAALAGAEETRRVEQKQKAVGAKFLIYASPVYIGLFLGVPVWLYHNAQQRLAYYYHIGRDGRTAEATVENKSTTGSKRTEYLLGYRFTLPGGARIIHSESPVDYDLWDRTPIGSRVTALYLPQDPRTCRLTISARGEISKGAMRESIVLLVLGAVASAVYIGAAYSMQMRQIGRWKDPEPVSGMAHLNVDQVRRMKGELRTIGLARVMGIWIGGASMAILLVMCMVLMLLAPFIPALNAAMTSHHPPGVLTQGMMVLCVSALGGWMVMAPLGEAYAFLRTRSLENELADPHLAPEIVTVLQRSTTMEKNLGGTASKRLLNALTVALGDPRIVDLTEKQRRFIYQLLLKWQSAEDRTPFCRAAILAAGAWQDEPGQAALRTVARSSQLPELRELAAAAVDRAGSAGVV